jgi:hypothetical protein
MPKKISTSDFFIDFEDFNKGLYSLLDTTKAPFGSARIMENVQITDRGGVGPRPGIELIGTDEEGGPVNGLFEFKKAFGNESYLIRARDDVIEILPPSEDTWHVLKDGLESGKEFDFASSIVNDQNDDLLVGSNRFDPYFSWNGAVSKIQSTSGGDITVSSTLEDNRLEADIATGSSTTTVTNNKDNNKNENENGNNKKYNDKRLLKNKKIKFINQSEKYSSKVIHQPNKKIKLNNQNNTNSTNTTPSITINNNNNTSTTTNNTSITNNNNNNNNKKKRNHISINDILN